MFRRIIPACFFAMLAVFCSPAAFAGKMELTTYYPAPVGEYETLSTTGNTYLATASGKKVGIGTTSPAKNFHIYDSTDSASLEIDGARTASSRIVLMTKGNGYQDLGGNNLKGWAIAAIGNEASGAQQNDLSFAFVNHTDWTYPFHIESGGNVGVGTTTPICDLHIYNKNNDGLLGIEGSSTTQSRLWLYTKGDGGARLASLPHEKWEITARSHQYTTTDERRDFLMSYFDGTDWQYRFFIEHDTGNVGIGTTTPAGRLDVNGTIFQRGGLLHADYVFEPDYKLEPIEDHAQYMWKYKHLKAVPKGKVDENGQQMVEIGANTKGILEELEKAHVYIQQLNERIKVLEARFSSALPVVSDPRVKKDQ